MRDYELNNRATNTCCVAGAVNVSHNVWHGFENTNDAAVTGESAPSQLALACKLGAVAHEQLARFRDPRFTVEDVTVPYLILPRRSVGRGEDEDHFSVVCQQAVPKSC